MEYPGISLGKTERIEEAEGKLRLFRQMKKGCSHCQAEGKCKHRKLPHMFLPAVAALAQFGFRSSSEQGRRTSLGCQLGLWAVVCRMNPGFFLPE